MRIMLHCPYPKMPTGYANQAALIVPRLAAAGHDVAISCTAGIVRHDTGWEDWPVYGRSPYTDMAEDLVRFHYDHFKADLIITLCCPWMLHPQVWRDMRTIHMMPVDCEPMGARDHGLILEDGATPAAVSAWGLTQMRKRDLDPLFLPHAVDTAAFRPPDDRGRLRKAAGLSHLFVAGMNGANTDTADRKAFSEQFQAFALFHARHPKSVLMVHAAAMAPDGLNLMAIAYDLGLKDAVIFSDQYQLAAGGATTEELRAWYGTLDVLLHCSRAEGYGVPVAEALACGTPVITGSWSGQADIAGPASWLCAGQKEWAEIHHAWWRAPLVKSVAGLLERALNGCGSERRERARQWAETELDADRLFDRHWMPVLKDLDA